MRKYKITVDPKFQCGAYKLCSRETHMDSVYYAKKGVN